jgi:hypothetical protein
MPTLTHGDAQDLLERYKRARERRDPDLAVSLYREDGEHRDDPFREPYVGVNAIREMWNDIAATQTNVEYDAERIWVSGTTVLASYHGAYTRQTNAERVRVRGFMTIELDEAGSIARLREWPVSGVVGTDSTFRAEPR